jgi:acetyl esterase/lipase
MREADMVAREIADRAEAVVVSVDYGLVPEVAYPVPHHQVVEALRWAVGGDSGLVVDAARVTLGGASAGAALALAAARQLVADGGPFPTALVLAYPVAHRHCPVEPEHEALLRQLPPLLRFEPGHIEEMNEAYLAQHAEPRFGFVDLEPAGIGAALAGLPPALVLIAEYDDLRGSAELLVRQAREAGWPVERRLCAGMVHGHLNRTPVLAETDRSLDAIARIVRDGGIRPEIG